jgi:hypothetical protein
MSVSGCGSDQTHPVVVHPPVEDLLCPAEPLVNFDPTDELAGVRYDESVRKSGQLCRDALGRVCRWHVAQGMTDVDCPPEPKSK